MCPLDLLDRKVPFKTQWYTGLAMALSVLRIRNQLNPKTAHEAYVKFYAQRESEHKKRLQSAKPPLPPAAVKVQDNRHPGAPPTQDPRARKPFGAEEDYPLCTSSTP